MSEKLGQLRKLLEVEFTSTEATAPAKTETPDSKPGKPPHPFVSLCAERARVVVQQKSGIVIHGRMKRLTHGMLSLTDATVIGLSREIVVPWIIIDHQSIAHLHPDVDAAT